MCWACPFSQERRRCHGGRKRVARSLSFSQVCARCHGGRKAPKGCLSGAGELASGKRERTHYIERALFAGAPPLPWREKARCAEFVLFTGMRIVMVGEKRRRDVCPTRRSGRRRIAPGASLFTGVRVVMVGEKRRVDVCPAHGNPSGEAGEGALRRACPFSQARHRCHSGGKVSKGCIPGTEKRLSEKREKVCCAECALFAGAPPLP